MRIYNDIHRYRSVKDPQTALRQRMREIAQTRVRYGYRRVHVLLKREGWRVNRNRVYRLYAEEQLQLRSKLPKRRTMVVSRRERCVPIRPCVVCRLDFVANQLADGTRLRALAAVDNLVVKHWPSKSASAPACRGRHVSAESFGGSAPRTTFPAGR